MKKAVNPDALVLINFQGYLKGEHGRSARSIYRTLLESGFSVNYYSSAIKEESGDLHFIASLSKLDFDSIDDSRLTSCCQIMPHKHADLITDAKIDLKDAIVLTDDKPQLETLNSFWNEEWRKNTIETYLINLRTYKIPYFK